VTHAESRSRSNGAAVRRAGGRAVAVMARPARAGEVKRRLAAAVGDDEALRVYRRLLDDTFGRLDALDDVTRAIAVAPVVASVTAGADAALRRPGWARLVQRGEGLGERLTGVFDDLFAARHEVVAIVGGDSPALPPEYVDEALARAAGGELVFGPAADGGYYLVACSRAVWLAARDRLAAALRDAGIGTATTLDDTLTGVAAAGVPAGLLPLWVDVDEAADLPLMERLLDGSDSGLRGLPLGGLREVYLHVTDRCATGCVHCYNGATPVRGDELDAAAWRGVVDACVRLGAGSFVILGGDPFLRDDLFELIAHITSERAASARVFFNREIDVATADELARAGSGRLRPLVSIDGAREVNDALRRPGNFDGVLRALAALRDAGLSPVANSVALRPVLASLPGLVAQLASLGVGRLHLIFPHQRGSLGDRLDLVPTGVEMRIALRELDAACTAAGVVLDNLVSWRRRLHGRQDLCTAGCRDLAVDPYGRVYACAITCGDPAFVAGDLRRRDLGEIWRRSPSFRLLRAARARDRLDCASCAVVDACGGECWTQAHYAARAQGAPAGYRAAFPYCGLVGPVFEELIETARAHGDDAACDAACGGQSAAGEADLTLFDCI
jgi:uncharacterized protein